MGFKDSATAVRCPLFHNIIKTTKGQFIGIECEPININLGFDVNPVLRLNTWQDLKDYTEIFCEDCYTTCPYYKAHTNMRGA